MVVSTVALQQEGLGHGFCVEFAWFVLVYPSIHPTFYHSLACSQGHAGAYPSYLRAKAGYSIKNMPGLISVPVATWTDEGSGPSALHGARGDQIWAVGQSRGQISLQMFPKIFILPCVHNDPIYLNCSC